MKKIEEIIKKLGLQQMLETIGEYNSLEELAEIIVDSLDDQELDDLLEA